MDNEAIDHRVAGAVSRWIRRHKPALFWVAPQFIFRQLPALWLSSVVFLMTGSLSAFSGTTRTQTFQLKAGWNAIYLAVEPSDNSPAVLFADVPVDIVAVFDEVISTRQFTSNPDTDMLRQLGWGLWYAPARDDAFLSDLGAIYGHKAYLVHATADVQLAIEGDVSVHPVWWKPSAYNLVGFTLDSLAPPTFAQFFKGSAAHTGQAVYRMVDGSWRKVSAPSSTLMKSGEAYWIYCNQSSDYQGPLTVKTSTPQGVVLQGGVDDLVLKNDTAYPLQPTIEHVLSGTDFVPMSVVINVIGETKETLDSVAVSFGTGAWSQLLPPLESGKSIRVPLQARSAEITVPEVTSLLCIKTDLGTETWVPVTGLREDLK